jgi:exocyst complex component 7
LCADRATQLDIDAVIAAIERLRQPADSKNDEEQIIRSGPDKAGLSNYLSSVKRLSKSLAEMQASNLRANQQTMADLTRLIKSGNSQLESHFDKLLRGETPRSIEPLQYVTKEMPFPVLSQDKVTRLGLINAYVSGNHRQSNLTAAPHDSSVARIYAEIRAPYLSSTIANLASASVSMAKKKNPDAAFSSPSTTIYAVSSHVTTGARCFRPLAKGPWLSLPGPFEN